MGRDEWSETSSVYRGADGFLDKNKAAALVDLRAVVIDAIRENLTRLARRK